MKHLIVQVNGTIYKGLAYWSDRTIPGHWAYPNWYREIMKYE